MKYKLFFTTMCPNCPAVKEFMAGVEMEGELIDASKPEGMEEAQKFDIAAVPTVVFLDGDEVKNIAHSVDEIKNIIQNKTLV